MRSSRVVLHNESQELYDTLSDRFFQLFQPSDIFEQELVTNIVNARWRIRRLEAADTANLNLAMEQARPDFEKTFDNLTRDHENALALRALAQTAGHGDIIARYEDRQHRIFERSYRLLCKHRGKQGPFPSTEAVREIEADLPPDNLSIEGSPCDAQMEAFEPEPVETPPSVSLRPVASPKRSNNESQTRDDNQFIAYPEDFAAIRPIFEALKDRPELRIAVSEAMMEYRARTTRS
jgi:hypothetical protein